MLYAALRHYESHDWISLLYFVYVCVILLLKSIDSKQTWSFIYLFKKNNFLVNQKHSRSHINLYNTILLLLHCVGISFVVSGVIGWCLEIGLDWKMLFVRILGIYSLTCVIQLFTESIFASLLGLDIRIPSFQFYKWSYKIYWSLLLFLCFPLAMSLRYISRIYEVFYLGFFFVIYLVILIFIYKKHENRVAKKKYLIISYICVFEIIPYLLFYLTVKINILS